MQRSLRPHHAPVLVSYALLWGALAILLAPVSPAAAQAGETADAVEHRGVVYVSLADLLDGSFLDGTFELADWGRTIAIRAGGRRVRFEEGGDRAAVDDRAAVPLRRPVLVLDGDFYLPAQECAPLLGYTCELKPSPALIYAGKRLPLDVEALEWPHLNTRVADLRPVRRAVVLASPLPARRHLHDDLPPLSLPSGAVLLVRREVGLDGVAHALVTVADETLETYAVRLDALQRSSREGSLDGTHLGRVFQRLSDLAGHSAAINHGPRQRLPRTVAVTADLCWSLRPYERDFFRFVPRVAAMDGQASVTLFVTGRWLEQHPEEMERLIALSREPGVGITWALHSHVHPKERPFMNRYDPAEVRADNLRTEHDLLEWGIVPSIFYRFPGLVHDEPRLRAILDLDLISVDCDSWVASMHRDRPPHHQWPRDGSILLIHGNGNEPSGIDRLYQWMIENDGWTWGPLHRFIGAEVDDDDEIVATTAPATRPWSDFQGERRDRRRGPAAGH